MSTAIELKVYYDGLCPLCSREIDHYRQSRGAARLRFVDITAPDFDAYAEEVDPVKVHKVMHVKSSEGELHTGVEAFIAIWGVLPGYSWLARMAKSPVVHPILKVGYSIFANVRPFLPRKRRNECNASPYCGIEEKS